MLLDKAGKLLDYIKKRLCWLHDSFRMYLRDTAIIQHQHVDALLVALTMTARKSNSDMHKYADKID